MLVSFFTKKELTNWLLCNIIVAEILRGGEFWAFDARSFVQNDDAVERFAKFRLGERICLVFSSVEIRSKTAL